MNKEIIKSKGRPKSVDPKLIIAELKARSNGVPYENMDELKEMNPDLAGKFKTMKNLANEIFGMSFVKYLTHEGLLRNKSEVAAEKAAEKAREKEKNTADAVVQLTNDLVSRYPNGSIFDSVVYLLNANLDLKEKYRGLVKTTDDSLYNLLYEKGIIYRAENANYIWGEIVEKIRKANICEVRGSDDLEGKLRQIEYMNIVRLNKIAKDAFGMSAFEALVSQGIIRHKKTSFASEALENEARESILKAISDSKKHKKHYKNVMDFIEQNPKIKKETYYKINKKFLELFGLDAASYLSQQGVIPSDEEIIENFIPDYDAVEIFSHFYDLLNSKCKKVTAIDISNFPVCNEDYSYHCEYVEISQFSKYEIAAFVYDGHKLDEFNEMDRVKLVRDPNNPSDTTCIRAETEKGVRFGNLTIENILAPLYDCRFVKIYDCKVAKKFDSCTLITFKIDVDYQKYKNLCETEKWYETVPVEIKKKEEKRYIILNQYSYEVPTTYLHIGLIGYTLFRGFRNQIEEVVDYIKEEYSKLGYNTYSPDCRKTATPDIYELQFIAYNSEVKSKIILNIIKKYPCLKAVAFCDIGRGGLGGVLISEPGYGFITGLEEAGAYDYKSEFSYIFENDPTVDFKKRFEYMSSGEDGYINYHFPFKYEWKRFDYLKENNGRLEAIKSVKLPEGIIVLDDFAYCYSNHLEEIYLPTSIRIIKKNAFEGCNNLNVIKSNQQQE